DIDGVRAVFEHGWGLVRASNTQPVLVLRFEADSQEELSRIEQKVKGSLEAVLKNLNYKQK
ncbi:MAG TPA: phosphomannomutase, partial [Acidobacteria bacterium]|nr:phosphomannomutase [Acidobacteriota bacterium]